MCIWLPAPPLEKKNETKRQGILHDTLRSSPTPLMMPLEKRLIKSQKCSVDPIREDHEFPNKLNKGTQILHITSKEFSCLKMKQGIILSAFRE
jgi:hypothetical protein